MYAVEVDNPISLVDSIRQFARLIDSEYAAAEKDLNDELYCLGTQGEDVFIPLDVMLCRLTTIAYRFGYMAAKQN